MSARRRAVTAMAATALAIGLSASPAWAHVEPDPEEVPANVPTRVELVVEHGCGSSPIAKVVTRLPAEAVDVTADAPDGWTVSIAAGVVTWDGAARPVQEDLRVGLTFTARAQPGTELGFPTIESCPNGTEVRWIEDIPSSDDESKHPLPRVMVVAGAPAPTTTSATTAAAAATTAGAATTTAATTTAPAPAATTTAAGLPPSSTSATEPAAAEKRSSGSTGAIVTVASALVVAAAFAAVVAVRRRRPSTR